MGAKTSVAFTISFSVYYGILYFSTVKKTKKKKIHKAPLNILQIPAETVKQHPTNYPKQPNKSTAAC